LTKTRAFPAHTVDAGGGHFPQLHWFGRIGSLKLTMFGRFGMIVTFEVVHPDRIRSVAREEFDTIQRKTVEGRWLDKERCPRA